MWMPPPQMPQYQYAESTGADRRGRANTARCRADTAPRKLTAQQIFASSPADLALQLACQGTEQRRTCNQLDAGCCSSQSLLGAGRAGPCAHRGTCSTLGNVVLLRHLCCVLLGTTWQRTDRWSWHFLPCPLRLSAQSRSQVGCPCSSSSELEGLGLGFAQPSQPAGLAGTTGGLKAPGTFMTALGRSRVVWK